MISSSSPALRPSPSCADHSYWLFSARAAVRMASSASRWSRLPSAPKRRYELAGNRCSAMSGLFIHMPIGPRRPLA